MNDPTTLQLSTPAPGVLLAMLDRPARRNALSYDMFEELIELQHAADADPDVRVLILSGNGPGFCAGLDLDIAATLPTMPASEFLTQQERWSDCITGFSTMKTPVVAAVNGAAAGAGMSLSLNADIRIASTTARFNAAFVTIGMTGGDVGSSYLLPRLVGAGRAAEILLTGRFVDAGEALAIGLVTDVVEPDHLLDRAVEVAAMIARNSPVGVRLTKEVLRANAHAPSLDAAAHLENRNQVLVSRTVDMVEALTAFREKREPTFIGR